VTCLILEYAEEGSLEHKLIA
jgi:serine/threonine protein kinase